MSTSPVGIDVIGIGLNCSRIRSTTVSAGIDHKISCAELTLVAACPIPERGIAMSRRSSQPCVKLNWSTVVAFSVGLLSPAAESGEIMRLYQASRFAEAAALVECGGFTDSKDYIAASGLYQHGLGVSQDMAAAREYLRSATSIDAGEAVPPREKNPTCKPTTVPQVSQGVSAPALGAEKEREPYAQVQQFPLVWAGCFIAVCVVLYWIFRGRSPQSRRPSSSDKNVARSAFKRWKIMFAAAGIIVAGLGWLYLFLDTQ